MSKATSIIKTTRNPYLDYLRGISALLVLLFHYTTRYDMMFGHVGDYPVMVKQGSFAVLMFFLLSGYLTFRGIKRYKPKDFVKSRFLRLFPAFWLCLVVTMIVVKVSLPELAVSMKDFLLNFTMIPAYLGAKYVDGAYWTLSCELFFYILILVVLCLRGEKYAHINIILGWFVVQIGVMLLPDSGLFSLMKKFNQLLYFHCFMAGGVVAVLEGYIDEKRKFSNGTYTLMAALLVALVFFVAQQYIDHDSYSGTFMAISVVMLCISIVVYNKLGGYFIGCRGC